MKDSILYFETFIHTAFSLYFKQETKYTSLNQIPLPEENQLQFLTKQQHITHSERIVLLLAIIPYINPQSLDLFFTHNKNIDRPYTEFGGWTGVIHKGFLPTVQTAIFTLSADDNSNSKTEVLQLFKKDHWFYRQDILRLKGPSKNEPFSSSKLCVSDIVLKKLSSNIL